MSSPGTQPATSHSAAASEPSIAAQTRSAGHAGPTPSGAPGHPSTRTSLTRLRDDQYVDAEAVGVDEVRLDVGRHDPVAQRLDESHVSLSREGVRVYPIVTRYAWPSELDLMARIAGLLPKDRWSGWNREPFNATSRTHVSVYGR